MYSLGMHVLGTCSAKFQITQNQGWRSRGPGSVSRPASRPYFKGLGLGLGLGCPCLGLGLGLGGPGFVYRVSRTGLGLEAGLET